MDLAKIHKERIEEIVAGLEKPGKTRSGLARELGTHPNVITYILKGTRRVALDEWPIIQRYLELNDTCEVIGHVADDGSDEIIMHVEKPREKITKPRDIRKLVAVEVLGGSLGVGLIGCFVFFEHQLKMKPDIYMMGSLCACGLRDGRILMKVPQQGARRGRFLLQPNGPGRLVSEVEVLWMSPVLHVASRVGYQSGKAPE